jgi:hypothetical protein
MAVQASREARRSNEDAGSFDGGYRGRRGVAPGPGLTSPTANQLMQQAIQQSRIETEQSLSDHGHTIIVNV